MEQKQKVMLSGIKPTGKLTLGNYIGAIKQFVTYQDDYKMYVFIADLHSLTLPIDPNELRENTRDLIAIYLAAGIDPNKVVLFKQSDVPPHAELGYVMACNSNMGELKRMTQFKDKTAKLKENDHIPTGIYIYPTLMAADILLYDADYVPVGIDQKQHVELTRDLAIRFNHAYGDTFKIPEPVVARSGAKINSLSDPTKKMSKSESDKGTIYLLEDLAITRKKIMSAVTDMENRVIFNLEKQPGIANLLTIMSSITGRDINEIAKEYENGGYGNFKRAVADVVCEELEKLQARVNEIKSSGKIEKILEKGAISAMEIASKKLDEVYKKVGIR